MPRLDLAREELNRLMDRLEAELLRIEEEAIWLESKLKELFPHPKVRMEYRRCGKASCHCAKGKLHGPYYYAYYKQGGKTKAIYFGRKHPALPEGAIPPAAYRDLVRAAERLRSRREKLLEAVAKAQDVLASALGIFTADRHILSLSSSDSATPSMSSLIGSSPSRRAAKSER